MGKTQKEWNRRYRDKRRQVKQPCRKLGAPQYEGEPEQWLLHYMPRAFPLPFGQVHRDIIAEFVYAIDRAGKTAIAAPRGTGKSTLVNGLTLWALLTGRSLFPVVLPWAEKSRKQALRFWVNELCFNSKLHADYADVTAPFKQCGGDSNKLARLTDPDSGDTTGAQLQITDGIIVLPGDKGAIGSATINGNPRGLNYKTRAGEVVRPTLAIIDDPQDRKTASSTVRIEEAVAKINGDVLGMAGPDSAMPIVMPCTVIKKDDVADRYLNDPDWRSIRVRQIVSWPAEWTDLASAARKLWTEWNELRMEGQGAKDEGKSALEFYALHREEMVNGLAVSWDDRYDRKRGQPDAMYAAMHDFYSMGEEAFMAERQNEPINSAESLKPYLLTADLICTRQAQRKVFEVPDWVGRVIASTDLNPSYAITSAIVGYGNDQTAAVPWYGVYSAAPLPISNDMPQAERKKKVFLALSIHGKQLAGSSLRPVQWFIDASGEYFDEVVRFCQESVRLCGLSAIPCVGRAHKKYNPYSRNVFGKPAEGCHMRYDIANGRRRMWLVWDADYWKEIAQRAWLGEIGSPGSCSLYAGNHRHFADQICREPLKGKAEIGGEMIWNWGRVPGPHDYGDVMAQAYAGAAWGGIGTGGRVAHSRQRRKKPSITWVGQ